MLDADQITIVGTGLLGASCGLGLRAAGYRGRIVGVGRRIETVQRAVELGCVDTAETDLGVAVRESQLVILATPLGKFAYLLKELALHDHDQLVITDVGSTKQQVCTDARAILPIPARFIGSHPMAGGEQHGPNAARADLFKGKPCVITDDADSDPTARQRVETLWTTLQMRVIHMSAAEHDQKVARISHLPHALAVLLLDLVTNQGGLDLASTGFRDTTRVASGDPEVWLDIFTTNRQAVIETIDQYASQLSGFKNLLLKEKDNELLEMLKSNKEARDEWIDRL